MKSIAFPNMFNGRSTNVVSDKEATISNLKLLLQSYKKTLFGDPYYGTNLLSLIYEQNNYILVDIVKDEIYTDILEFMPQLQVERNNIELVGDKSGVSVNIVGKNLLNGMTDLYSIRLINNDENV